MAGPVRILSTQELRKERMSTCKACPHYNNDKNKCGSCGCYLPAKIALQRAKCPINKW